jgi:hypothetical protein
VGAHYYTWFPANFDQGYLRKEIRPKQKPLLGKYCSTDPAVIEQHAAWCSEYGIDFLTLDWWPTRTAENKAFLETFLNVPNLEDIRFCIHYETWELGFDNECGATRFDDRAVHAFLADMRMFAEGVFKHPSYLKVNGRPVIILYLTRTFHGKYVEAMKRFRAEMAGLGVNPYVIGDEAFWGVIAADGGIKSRPGGAESPQPSRIRLFDAITAYNMYDWSRKEHAGYAARSSFVPDVAALWGEYADAAAEQGVAFVPDIVPGYNDRGVRLVEDHYAIPRQWDEGLPEGSLLAESFDRLAFPFVAPGLNMILITSFNEWNEDTAIEPLAESAPTASDRSRSGARFTQGFQYSGHGFTYMEVVRNKTTAVHGRVVLADGNPARGAAVVATRDGRNVGRGISDSRGFYTLSRLRMPPGDCRIEIEGRAGTATNATVDASSSVAVDFRIGG